MKLFIAYILMACLFFTSCEDKNVVSDSFVRSRIIESQREIDNFNLERVGELIIKGSNINNLRGLSTLKQISFKIEIEGTNIKSLEGLENVVIGNEDEYAWPVLTVQANHKLTDVTAAQNFVSVCVKLFFNNNDSLTSFGNLEIPVECNVVLGDLPLVDFKSIVFPKQLRSLEIWRMPDLVDLSGLENIEQFYNGGSSFRKLLLINWNPKLKSLNGLNNFNETILVTNNESLTDYCALKNPKLADLDNNLFNPTDEDFDNGKCKQ